MTNNMTCGSNVLEVIDIAYRRRVEGAKEGGYAMGMKDRISLCHDQNKNDFVVKTCYRKVE